MKTIKEPQQNCKLQNPLDAFRKRVHENAPGLARLLDDLDAGVTPGPLEVMIAISQGVAYFTDGQAFPVVDAEPGLAGPAARCRAC